MSLKKRPKVHPISSSSPNTSKSSSLVPQTPEIHPKGEIFRIPLLAPRSVASHPAPTFPDQPSDGAADFHDLIRCDVGIDLRGFRRRVSQQFLNVSEVDPLFQEVGSEAVSEGVDATLVIDLEILAGVGVYLLDGSLRQSFSCVVAFEHELVPASGGEPCCDVGCEVVVYHHYTFFPALGLADVEDFAIQGDIAWAEVVDFAQSQTASVGQHQDETVLGIAGSCNDLGDSFAGVDAWERLVGFHAEEDVFSGLDLEYLLEEECNGRRVLIHRVRGKSLVLPQPEQVLLEGACPVTAGLGCQAFQESRYRAAVVLQRFVAQVANPDFLAEAFQKAIRLCIVDCRCAHHGGFGAGVGASALRAAPVTWSRAVCGHRWCGCGVRPGVDGRLGLVQLPHSPKHIGVLLRAHHMLVEEPQGLARECAVSAGIRLYGSGTHEPWSRAFCEKRIHGADVPGLAGCVDGMLGESRPELPKPDLSPLVFCGGCALHCNDPFDDSSTMRLR